MTQPQLEQLYKTLARFGYSVEDMEALFRWRKEWALGLHFLYLKAAVMIITPTQIKYFRTQSSHRLNFLQSKFGMKGITLHKTERLLRYILLYNYTDDRKTKYPTLNPEYPTQRNLKRLDAFIYNYMFRRYKFNKKHFKIDELHI